MQIDLLAVHHDAPAFVSTEADHVRAFLEFAHVDDLRALSLGPLCRAVIVDRLYNGLPASVHRGFALVDPDDDAVPTALFWGRSRFLLSVGDNVADSKSYHRK